MSCLMNDTDDENAGILDRVKNGVGKLAKKRATKPSVDRRIHFGIVEDPCVGVLELSFEPAYLLRRATAIPRHCFSQIRYRLTGEDQLPRHFLPNSSSRISAHGLAEVGFA